MATITDFLNQMNQVGVFSYVLPFLLIFAVVFAILEKTGILNKQGKENKGVSAIIAAAIGLLALQFDIVSVFYARIFPNLGMGIAILVVILILLGLVGAENGKAVKGIGWVVAIVAVLWAIFNWDTWFGYGPSFSWFFYGDQFWSLVWIAIAAGAIYWMVKPKGGGKTPKPKGST